MRVGGMVPSSIKLDNVNELAVFDWHAIECVGNAPRVVLMCPNVIVVMRHNSMFQWLGDSTDRLSKWSCEQRHSLDCFSMRGMKGVVLGDALDI